MNLDTTQNNKMKSDYISKPNTVPSDQIYKVHLLDSSGKETRVIVFSNGHAVPVIHNGHGVVDVIFADYQIHLDDSIRVIKKKILFALLESANIKRSYEELYLFGKTGNVSQQRDFRIGTKESARLVGPEDTEKTGDSNLETVNPYSADIRKELPIISRQILFENRLLLNHATLYNNSMYLCFAEDVLEYYQENAETYVLQTYFPLLREKNIETRTDLIAKRTALWNETRTILDENTAKLYRTVQLFYDVYNATERNTSYIRRGIQSVHFRIQIAPTSLPGKTSGNGSDAETAVKKMPLDMIFKLVHCSKDIPFIKFNPGNRRENLYRLYYEKMTSDGKKIPMLSGKQIQKLARETARNNQLSMYIPSRGDPMFLHFEHTGDISIQCTFSTPLSRIALDDYVKETLNPVLTKLTSDFRQTGYTIPSFRSFSEENIRVVSMKYVAGVRIERDVKIDKIQCIYSLLTVNKSAGEEIVRYKRVENYKEMDAETALITELYNTMQYTEMTGAEMLEIVSQRFGMTEERAKARVVESLSDAHEYNGSIIEHPGFPMKIGVSNLDYILGFEVDGIDSIRYIEPLEIYIESIVKMTQEIKPRSELAKHIRDVCSHSKRTGDADKSHVDNMMVSDYVAKPVGRIQPVDVSTMGDIDIFQELGFTDDYTSETEEERVDETPLDEEEERVDQNPLDEEERLAEDPLNENTNTNTDKLLSDLYKNSGVFFEKENESDSETEEEQGVFFDSDDESDMEGGGTHAISEDPAYIDGGATMPPVQDMDDARIRPDGLSLNHPNPFLRRMQTREPSLFLTKPTGKKYKSYSASCQPTSRQPVILTESEKQRIDKEYPGSYKNAIKYGTDPKKPYWYICPRYWCFLTNSSISDDDVKAGKCGTIIPDNASTIPKGAYVYEFKGVDHTGVKGEYVEHHPGFMKDGKHPDGYCLPCCFKNWDKVSQQERREQCSQETSKAIVSSSSNEATAVDAVPKSSLYVISLDTYPVPPTRWGFMPLSVQLLFHIDYQTVVDKNNSAVVMPNTPTFLRYGVEQHDLQSFLGVFADIYAYQQRQLAIPTIAEFKRILLQQLTLDIFVQVHNSSLTTTFRPSNKKAKLKAIDEAIPTTYAESEFAKRLDITKPEQLEFLKETIASYENFMTYITHPSEPIDHTYLWDIFTSDIAGLNRGGVNLVLLEIMENDVTDNIQLVCPTNSYSKYAYDSRKETVFVLKHDNIYEPLYLYEFVKTSERVGITSQRTFRWKTIHKNIQLLLTNIEKTSSKYCMPLPSLPRVYEFSEPILLDVLVEQIYALNYIPIAQITNYRNKVIGVVVRADVRRAKSYRPSGLEAKPSGFQGFTESSSAVFGKDEVSYENDVMLPCFPSAPSRQFKTPVPLKTMDDETVWKDYTTTRDTLLHIYRESGHKIPCLPKVKIVEDEMVVGFLTATNQFVQIIPPSAERVADGILEHESVNPNTADTSIATSREADKTRVEMTARIRLENQFYVAFRNTVRELLNDYVYREQRNAVLRIIENQTHLYHQQLSKMKKELQALVSDKVVFVDIDMDVLMELNDIVECDPNAKETPYCLVKENGVQQLSIPKTNLLSKTQDNESMYYIRLADELLRNNRIRMSMLESETYFNIADIRYQIHPDEFLLSQTALQGNYFENMIGFNDSEYVKHTNYENAQPSITQTYTNDVIPVNEQYATETIRDEASIECIDSIVEVVGNTRSMWKRSFPSGARETVYKNTSTCSFFVLVSILKTHTGTDYTISQIKEKLWNGYSRILEKSPDYLVKIVGMLRRQGKRTLMEPVVKRRETLDSVIFGEDYYISDMDIWVMAQTYQLPVILFSPNGLKGFAVKLEWIKCSGRISDKYSFVRSTIRLDKPNGISNYHLIQPTFALSELREFYTIATEAFRDSSRNIQSIETTLDQVELIAK